jgi:hypothetical protein
LLATDFATHPTIGIFGTANFPKACV